MPRNFAETALLMLNFGAKNLHFASRSAPAFAQNAPCSRPNALVGRLFLCPCSTKHQRQYPSFKGFQANFSKNGQPKDTVKF